MIVRARYQELWSTLEKVIIPRLRKRLCFLVACGLLAFMVEWPRPKDKVGIQGEGCDPMGVVLESHQRSAFLRVPNANGTITAGGIQDAFGATRATPFDDVDAGTVSAESVFQTTESGVPDADSPILGRRGKTR